MPSHSLQISPKEGRLKRIVGLISHFREKSACTPADASIVVTQIMFYGRPCSASESQDTQVLLHECRRTPKPGRL